MSSQIIIDQINGQITIGGVALLSAASQTGQAGKFLTTNGTTATWSPAVTSVNVTGGTTGLTTSGGPVTGAGTIVIAGTLALTNGGTGATTQTAAFDALSPLTNAGDILYYNGTHNVRLAVGSTGQVLTVAAGEPSWATGGGGGGSPTVPPITTAAGTGSSVVLWDPTNGFQASTVGTGLWYGYENAGAGGYLDLCSGLNAATFTLDCNNGNPAGAGTGLTVRAGFAGSGTNANGGDLSLVSGPKDGTGTDGIIVFQIGNGGVTALTMNHTGNWLVGNGSGSPGDVLTSPGVGGGPPSWITPSSSIIPPTIPPLAATGLSVVLWDATNNVFEAMAPSTGLYYVYENSGGTGSLDLSSGQYVSTFQLDCSSDPGTGHAGTKLTFRSGFAATSSNLNGGDMEIYTGSGDGTGTPGNMHIGLDNGNYQAILITPTTLALSGLNQSTTNGGDITIFGGNNAATANGGNVVIQSGIGDVHNGAISISTGGSLSPAPGDVDLFASGNLSIITPNSAIISIGGSAGISGQVLTSDGTNTSWGTAVAGAGGSNTQLQYNNSGVLAGTANITTDGSTITFTSLPGVGTGAIGSNYFDWYQSTGFAIYGVTEANPGPNFAPVGVHGQDATDPAGVGGDVAIESGTATDSGLGGTGGSIWINAGGAFDNSTIFGGHLRLYGASATAPGDIDIAGGGHTTARGAINIKGGSINLNTTNGAGGFTLQAAILGTGDFQWGGNSGTSGQVLTSAGAGSPPTWANPAPVYTLATLPTATAGFMITVSDANSGAGALCYSDGTTWKDAGTHATVV